MIREELRKYVSRLEADKALATDVDVEELYDDIESGEHEFEAEPDLFGLGYAEMVEQAPHDDVSGEPEPEPAPPVKPEKEVAPDPQSAT